MFEFWPLAVLPEAPEADEGALLAGAPELFDVPCAPEAPLEVLAFVLFDDPFALPDELLLELLDASEHLDTTLPLKERSPFHELFVLTESLSVLSTEAMIKTRVFLSDNHLVKVDFALSLFKIFKAWEYVILVPVAFSS